MIDQIEARLTTLRMTTADHLTAAGVNMDAVLRHTALAKHAATTSCSVTPWSPLRNPVTSRSATNELLAGLRAGQWRPSAWRGSALSSAQWPVQ